MLRFALLFALSLLLAGGIGHFPPELAAQDPALEIRIPPEDVVQQLELRDGSTLFGRVTREGDPFQFQLLSGQTLEVRAADVRSIRAVRGRVVEDRVWREDPNRTRLFFGPTGRSLRAGDGYISVFQVIFPILAYGVTDRVTLAAGTPLFFGDRGDMPFWFAPKVGLYESEEVAVAAGVLAFFVAGEGESVGLVYGAGSFGSPDRGVHAGVGFGYAGTDLADRPVFMIGAETRVSPGVKVLTENYFLPGEGGIASAGVRFFGERLSADLGLAAPFSNGQSFFAFPVVNFVWNF